LNQKVRMSASEKAPFPVRKMSALDNPPIADVFYGQPLKNYLIVSVPESEDVPDITLSRVKNVHTIINYFRSQQSGPKQIVFPLLKKKKTHLHKRTLLVSTSVSSK